MQLLGLKIDKIYPTKMFDPVVFLAVSFSLFCLIKAAHPASYYGYHPSKHEEIPHHEHHDEHDLKYEFGYRVHDPHYHNYQERAEAGGGDDVEGYYSFLEPNGFIRIVKYSSDKHGFRADVAHHVPSHKKEVKHPKSDSYFPPQKSSKQKSDEYPYA